MNKLKLKINDSLIYVKGSSISMIYKSPIFNNQDGSFTYDFDLQINSEIDVIFNFPRVANRKSSIGLIRPAELYYNDLNIISGELRILDVLNDSISVTLGFAKGSFNNKVNNENINNIGFLEKQSLGNDRIAFFNGMLGASYPEYRFCLPSIYNQGGYEFVRYYKHRFVDGQNLYYRNPAYSNNNGYEPVVDPNIEQTISPMIFLREIYIKFMKHLGYTIEEDFFDDNSDLNSLAVYTNLTENYEKVGNEWFFDLNKYLPHLKWSEFSEQIDETFNTVTLYNNNSQTVKIINKNSLLNITESRRFDKEKDAEILSRKKVQVTHGYQYYYDTGNMNEHFKSTIKDIFAPDSKYNYRGEIDLPFYSNTSSYMYENHDLYDVYQDNYHNAYVSFEPHLDSNGNLIHFKKISILEKRIITSKDDFTEVKQRISPIVTGLNAESKLDSYLEGGTAPYQEAYNLYNLDIAKIDYKLVVNPADEKLNKVILFFYRGFINGDPLANTELTDYSGIHVFNKSLHLDFMYNTYWKRWLDWYYSDREEVEITLPLTNFDLYNLTYEYPYEFTELGITGFLDSLEVDLETDIIPKAKIKIFTI